MPRIPMTLFTGSILVVVLCQAFSRQMSFGPSIAPANLLLTFGLLMCTAGILTSWLESRPRCQPVDEPSGSHKKVDKKDRTDRIN